MGDWPVVALGDLVHVHDSRRIPLSKAARAERQGPYRYFGAQGVIDYIDDYLFDGEHILIAEDGENLRSRKQPIAALVSGQFWVNNHAHIISARLGRADNRFLLHALNISSLDGRVTGAAQPKLTKSSLEQLKVECPSFSVQRRIAAVLSAFDELIEINERRIALLEDLARSLYEEWFVRFRFPGHEDVEVVDSELGPIPDGWEVRPLREIARLHRRPVKPAAEAEGEFEHFSIPAFDRTGLPESERGGTIRSGKQAVDGECVLLSKINARIERVWFAMPSTRRGVASTEFLVWTGVEASNAWLWAAFSGDAFRRWLLGVSGGTSTSHQRVKPRDVEEHVVPIAPLDLRGVFDKLATPALRQVTALRQRNRLLAATRDLLLPRLVTGRLDVSDIDLGDLLPADAA